MSATAARRVALFSGGFETLSLLIPLVTVAFLAFRARFPEFAGFTTVQVARFLVATVGLDVIHAYLTFSMLHKMPELQEWVHQVSGGKPHRFYLRAGLVFLSAFVVTGVVPSLPRVWSDPLFILLLAIAPGLGVHHQLAQHLGLSQLYGIKALRQLDYSQNERSRALRNLERERSFRHFLPGLYLASSASRVLLILAKHYRIHASWVDVLKFADPFLVWGLRLLLAAFVVNAFLFPKIEKTNKPWYLFRFAFIAFPGPYLFLALGKRVTHGYEYLAVYSKMSERSTLTSAERAGLHRYSFQLIAFGSLLFFLSSPALFAALSADGGRSYSPAAIPVWWNIFAGLYLACSITHFYLDALLFRMREPVTRELVGPLLLDGKSEDVGLGIIAEASIENCPANQPCHALLNGSSVIRPGSPSLRSL